MNKIVAIVGRPNVGKSTLFNRLVGRRQSIVHDEPGITRDRLYHDVIWNGKKFKIVDTGGIEIEDRSFQDMIKLQAQIAIEEAHSIILVLDGREGITADDEYVINMLRKSNSNILVVANKLEGNKEFDSSIWELGNYSIFPISAQHGEGVGDMLDELVSDFELSEDVKDKEFSLSIIGRPNAGKSSLLNQLVGNNRSIVSEVSGTTRDSVIEYVEINEEKYKIIDTAGISKKSKLIESVDHYALTRAMSSLADSDLTLLMIDATRELSHFDARLAGYAMEENKPIIIIINKWDLIKKTTMSMKRFEERVRKEFKFMSWAPVIFISAKNGLRIDKLFDKITEVRQNMSKLIKKNLLNEIVIELQIMQPPPMINNGRLNISYTKQIPSKIPTFLMFVNNDKFLHFSYKRYIENQFREYFGFEGTPIKILFRGKKGDENGKRH